MSGLLRRIKRSRPADAGEPPREGQTAAPEGAASTTDAATTAVAPTAPADVDPTVPRPPAGRRGRLRRRLRCLRSARELMLRDLGGLLYEIHRTGGGNVSAYATIVRAKVQRIADLDAEVQALETALNAPHGGAIVFQPGVGGACPACGELYGSAARFCSSCGAQLGGVPATEPATVLEQPTAAAPTSGEKTARLRPDSAPGPAPTAGDPLASREPRA